MGSVFVPEYAALQWIGGMWLYTIDGQVFDADRVAARAHDQKYVVWESIADRQGPVLLSAPQSDVVQRTSMDAE